MHPGALFSNTGAFEANKRMRGSVKSRWCRCFGHVSAVFVLGIVGDNFYERASPDVTGTKSETGVQYYTTLHYTTLHYTSPYATLHSFIH